MTRDCLPPVADERMQLLVVILQAPWSSEAPGAEVLRKVGESDDELRRAVGLPLQDGSEGFRQV